MSHAPTIKGWCPGAYAPMMAADGLLVRIRPPLAHLDVERAVGLCELALRFGSGFLDLTNRANVQIRSVAAGNHEALLRALHSLGLLDANPAIERRRNLLVNPFWQPGDQTDRLARTVLARLMHLPEMPAKTGFAVDCGPRPMLLRDPADFRIERGERGLILRADGADSGQAVREETLPEALDTMAEWFAGRITADHRRMASVVAQHPLPREWCTERPLPPAEKPAIGAHERGAFVAAPFGQIDANALARVLDRGKVRALRITPWRMVLLEGAALLPDRHFITDPRDPLLRVDACPGAPFCSLASVETRPLARKLAARVSGTLHVSGCAKGCARARAANITLVGREGVFDLVKNGLARDKPDKTGLLPKALPARILSDDDLHI